MGTMTWTQMRRELSRRLQEPFFRRFGNYGTADGGAANYLWDDALAKFTQNTGWTYASVFVPYTTDGQAPLGEELEVTNFLVGNGLGYAYVSPNFSAAIGAGDQYEIHSRFRVSEKLDAVNMAIREAFPAFYRQISDSSLILQKFKRTYDLSAFSPGIKHIRRVYIEPIWVFCSGVASSGGASTLTDSTQTFALDTSKTYEVAIYYGTGAGQVRTINVATSTGTHVLTVTTPWTTQPDSTSQFVVKNTLDVDKPWIGPQTRIRFDADNNTTTLEMLDGLTGYWGARVKIEYYALAAEITGESSTLDEKVWGYVLPQAMFHLYSDKIAFGQEFEVKTYQTLAQINEQVATAYRLANRFPPLTSTMHSEQRNQVYVDRERPFNT